MINTEEQHIIDYLRGRLSEAEKEHFYAWLEMEENKKLFFQVKAVYDCATSSRPLDIDAGWKRLLAKKAAVRPAAARRRKIYAWMKYVAVAVVAVLATSAFFRFQTKPEPVYTTEYIGGDGLEATVVVLPDGTRVSLGTRTRFRYDQTFGKARRLVYLEGEAFFEVAKQREKPFIVRTNAQDIEALGTKFNVMAYTSDSLVTTTLLEGAVRLTSDSVKEATVLSPNQQSVYNKEQHAVRVSEVDDASRFTSWIDGYYYFHKQPLPLILQRLSNVYGVRFEVRSEALNREMFTGTFYRGQSIKDILEIIDLSVPIRYKITGRTVVLYK